MHWSYKVTLEYLWPYKPAKVGMDYVLQTHSTTWTLHVFSTSMTSSLLAVRFLLGNHSPVRAHSSVQVAPPLV